MIPQYKEILEKTRLCFEAYESTIDRLRKRIDELEDETYKDKKMVEMKAKMEAMARGFAITEAEAEAIRDWKRRHQLEAHGVDIEKDYHYAGTIGGAWTYEFLPTSIGIIGSIRCHCGAKFTFRELD